MFFFFSKRSDGLRLGILNGHSASSLVILTFKQQIKIPPLTCLSLTFHEHNDEREEPKQRIRHSLVDAEHLHWRSQLRAVLHYTYAYR